LIGVRTGHELREAERELLGILAVIGYKEFEAAGKGVVQLRYVEGQQGLRMVKPKQVVAMYEPENGNGQVTLRAVPESMYPSVLRKFADGRYSPLVVLEQLGER
jgi:hypothetical protein